MDTRRLKVLILFSFIACLSLAQNLVTNIDQVCGGILWEISKDGIEHKSYLLGTHHGVEYAFIDTIPAYHIIMKKVEVVGTELMTNDESDYKNGMEKYTQYLIHHSYPAFAIMPDSITFKSIFSDSTKYWYVDNYIRQFKRENYANFTHTRITPLFIIKLMSMYKQVANTIKKQQLIPIDTISASSPKTEQSSMNLDAGIFMYAKELNKDMMSFESFSYQLRLDDVRDSLNATLFSLSEQAEGLYAYCRVCNGDSVVSDTRNSYILKAYLNNDLRELYRLNEEHKKEVWNICPDSTYLKTADSFCEDRNRNWIPKIVEYTKKHRCLFAVGALHLAGENGLIALLRREGYFVRPVDFKGIMLISQE